MAMRYCEGDVKEADYFVDCSFFMFYQRVRHKRDYISWYNDQQKASSTSSDE